MAFRRHTGGLLTIGQLQRDLADYCLNRMESRSLEERLCDFSDLMGTTLSYCRDYKDRVYSVTYEIGLLRATVRGSDELDCMNRCRTEILFKLKVFSMNGEDCSTPPPSTSSLPAERSVEKSREAKSDEINRLDLELRTHCDGLENARSDRTAADDIVLSPADDENQETKPVEKDLTENMAKLEPIELLQQDASEERDTDKLTEQNVEQSIPNAAAAPTLDLSDGIVEACNADDKIICEEDTRSHDESSSDKSVSVAEGTENHTVPPSVVLQDDKDAMAAEGTENVPAGNENNDIERESVVEDPSRKCETDAENGNAHDDKGASSEKVQDCQDLTEKTADLATETSCSRQPATAAGLYEPFIDDVSGLLNKLTVTNISETADSLLIMLAANDTHVWHIKLIVDSIVEMAVNDVADNCVLYASLCSKINESASNSEQSGVRDVVAVTFKHQLIDSCVSILFGTKLDNRPKPSAERRVEFDLESRIRSLVACRLLGELFLMDNFKIYFQVSRTVQNLIRSCDDRCLECLCILLTTVGPKLKKVAKTKKTHCSTEEIYEKLERCAALGRSDEGLPKRTVSMLDDLLRLKKNGWAREAREPETTTTVSDLDLAVRGGSDADTVVKRNLPLVDAKEGVASKPRFKILRVVKSVFSRSQGRT